jgi:hypothetical protein
VTVLKTICTKRVEAPAAAFTVCENPGYGRFFAHSVVARLGDRGRPMGLRDLDPTL